MAAFGSTSDLGHSSLWLRLSQHTLTGLIGMSATPNGRMRERLVWIIDSSAIDLLHLLADMCRDSSIP
jgi:hypothetical protein